MSLAFEPIEEQLKFASSFPEEDVEREKTRMLEETYKYPVFEVPGVFRIISELREPVYCNSAIYYDSNVGVFIWVSVDGDTHVGYEVSFEVISKDEALRKISRSIEGLHHIMEEMRDKGEIPALAIALSLPERTMPDDYVPPKELGRGTMWF